MNNEEIDKHIPPGLSLFRFQYDATRFLIERTRALLASDPGCGKSVQLIVAANLLNIRCQGLSVLVLCPKSIVLNWKREIKKWELIGRNEKGHYRGPLIEDKNGKGASATAPYIYWEVRNWDQLISSKNLREMTVDLDNYPGHMPRKWDIIIGDESHSAIKNPRAKRCQVFLNELVPKAGRVWLATATPASTSALDYYCTLQIVLPQLMEGWTARDFMKEFCNEVYNPFSPSRKSYTGFRNTHILKDIFKRAALRHVKSEVLPDLPPKIYTDIPIEVDKAIMADNLDLDIEYIKECVSEGRPLPGHIAHVMQATAMAKLDAAVEIITNFPDSESLVIFVWHRSVAHALEAALEVAYAGRPEMAPMVITGEMMDIGKRQELIDAFQASTRKRLICNIQSGGVGLTLTAARTAMFVEFPHSPIHWKQAQDRIHRIGSVGESVQIIKLIAIGCIDEAIFEALDRRIEAMSEVGV